jgi:uncharacterized membrane protein
MLHNSAKRAKTYSTAFVRFVCISPRCLASYFINGLIMIIPLAVTLWVVVWLFELVDGILSPALEWAFGLHIPGLGFAIIITSTALIGYFGIKVGHRRAFGLIETAIIKIPFAGAIYDGARQIMQAFSSKSGKKFLEVVFIEFPRQGIYTVGFVTGETIIRREKMLNVFVPTVPTPFGGFLQIVPAAQVIRSSMSVNDAMKLIISAGGFSPGEIADIIRQVPEPAAIAPLVEQDPKGE